MSRVNMLIVPGIIFALSGLPVGAVHAQSPVAVDQTEWARQQVEAETRRSQAERSQDTDDFLLLQQELAEQQETRRRMAAEEDRRRGPDRGGDIDPLRGREDPLREIEAKRQRVESERYQ